MAREDSVPKMRSELAALKARYDGGAVDPSILQVIQQLEKAIAWAEHAQAVRTNRVA